MGGMRQGGARRVVGELPPQPNQAVKKEVQKAFDFESSNAKFDKGADAVKPETKTENGTTTTETTATLNTPDKAAKKGYDKSTSFFDQISCETLDRVMGQDSRVDREKQRQLDCETFGDSAASVPRGRGFRRVYMRGGRGGRMGGGYGGYNRNAPSGLRYVPVNTNADRF